MYGTRIKVAVAGSLLLLAGASVTATAGGAGTNGARLDSLAEVPTLSTSGGGSFTARVGTTPDRIRYTLRYNRMTTAVQQAHIHLGRRAVNGGISAFLCTNIGGGSARTPACPRRGVVRGVIRRADVIGPTDQALGTGHFNELVRAVRSGAAYVNVHTARFPSGEIRGQIR
ncbi:MAG: CHRD domain-containing protein [Nocardioidaceae bacterium]